MDEELVDIFVEMADNAETSADCSLHGIYFNINVPYEL